MAVFKCKMCGGDLILTNEAGIAECDSCGSLQTVPNDTDEKKANLINRANKLRTDILEIVKNEPPFDVFICYKERDAYGERTKDSVLAQDIYYALSERGMRVFFARRMKRS